MIGKEYVAITAHKKTREAVDRWFRYAQHSAHHDQRAAWQQVADRLVGAAAITTNSKRREELWKLHEFALGQSAGLRSFCVVAPPIIDKAKGGQGCPEQLSHG